MGSNWFERIRDTRISRRGVIRGSLEIGASGTFAGLALVLGISLGEAKEYSESELVQMAMNKVIERDPPPPKDKFVPDSASLGKGIDVNQFNARFNGVFQDALQFKEKQGGEIRKSELFFGEAGFRTSSGARISIESGLTADPPRHLLKGEVATPHPYPDITFRRVTLSDMPIALPSYFYFEQVGTEAEFEIFDGFPPRVHTLRSTFVANGRWDSPPETHELSNVSLWNIAYNIRKDFDASIARMDGNPQQT
jgi:hypothetical protein